MSLQLRFVSHSEIGPVRKNNQDSGYASPRLLVVADGMGGAAAGDLASAVAIDTIIHLDTEAASQADSGAQLEQFAATLRRANDRIADLIADDYHLEGMGTTVTGALFDGHTAHLAHIGDSRAYLLRDGRLERLTHDHSWVQSLVDDGKISEAEASVHPHRSLLLRVLNGQPANEPDLTKVPLQVGDRLLFCSDGICGLVDDPDIAAALQLPDLEQSLGQLVDDALVAGGIDNITAIVADVVDLSTDSAQAASTDPGHLGQTAVLGAAAERVIPEVRQGLARGLADDDEDTLIRNRAPTASGAASGAASSTAASSTVGAAAGGLATTAGSASPSSEPDDEARYNPQPPRRGRLARVLAAAVVLAVVLGAGLAAGYAWTRNQYFVGAAADKVAIYQGLPESVPGVQLSTVYEIQPLLITSLPPYYRDMIHAGIEVESLDAARQTVVQLTDTAKRCAGPTPTPRPSTMSPTPATSPSATLPPVTPQPPRSVAPSPPRTTAPPSSPVGPTVPRSPSVQPSISPPPVAASPSPRPDC